MPKLVNNNSHPVRVRDDSGALHRIISGQVVDADGALADRLLATNGVTTASKDDVDRWDRVVERRATSGTMPGAGQRLAAKMALPAARAELRQQTIVAPLQRVVGDDAAPQGPPTGTITTRGEAATSGKPGDLNAFAQGEELVMQGVKVPSPGASEADVLAGRATQSDIHNAQVDNAAAAEAAAKRHLAVTGQSDNDGEEDGGPIEGDYKSHTKPELEGEIERRRDAGREIEVEEPGNKPQLVAALEHDDDAGDGDNEEATS